MQVSCMIKHFLCLCVCSNQCATEGLTNLLCIRRLAGTKGLFRCTNNASVINKRKMGEMLVGFLVQEQNFCVNETKWVETILSPPCHISWRLYYVLIMPPTKLRDKNVKRGTRRKTNSVYGTSNFQHNENTFWSLLLRSCYLFLLCAVPKPGSNSGRPFVFWLITSWNKLDVRVKYRISQKKTSLLSITQI